MATEEKIRAVEEEVEPIVVAVVDVVLGVVHATVKRNATRNIVVDLVLERVQNLGHVRAPFHISVTRVQKFVHPT